MNTTNTKDLLRPTPTKGELRAYIKEHGMKAALERICDIDAEGLCDGYNGRPHTRGQVDYWRLGRELAGMDRA